MTRPPTIISHNGNRLRVEGAITMGNAKMALEGGLAALVGDELQIDLAGVKEVDSSAVSMLLEWTRTARRENRRLTFVNLPQNLQCLARLYGVLDLLPGGGAS